MERQTRRNIPAHDKESRTRRECQRTPRSEFVAERRLAMKRILFPSSLNSQIVSLKDGDVLQAAAVPVVGLAPVLHVASDRGVGELDDFQLLTDARSGVREGAAGDGVPRGCRRIILYTDLIVPRSSARKFSNYE